MVEHVAPAETVIARPEFARSPSTQRLTSPSEASGLDTVSSAPTPTNGTTGKRPLGERFDLDRDVLTNGSRAVGACSRPFPVATFGVPKRLDFDIHSATFKMTVEVPAGDVADERAPTEIYLPWVHFASDAGFSTGPAGTPATVFKGDASSDGRLRAASSGSSFDSRQSDSPASTLVGKANGGQRKEGTVRIEDLSDASSVSESLGSGSGQTTAILPAFELDLEVAVSAGRFEVQGQTLRWWYGAPAAASSGPARRPTTYTITVKRRGGARKEMAHPRGQASTLWDVSSWQSCDRSLGIRLAGRPPEEQDTDGLCLPSPRRSRLSCSHGSRVSGPSARRSSARTGRRSSRSRATSRRASARRPGRPRSAADGPDPGSLSPPVPFRAVRCSKKKTPARLTLASSTVSDFSVRLSVDA
jgi:hypothetical protein